MIGNDHWPIYNHDVGGNRGLYPKSDGFYDGPASGFVAMVVGALQEGYALTRHSLSNTVFRFSGDECRCESLVTAQHLSLSRDEDIYYCGRYLDVLRRKGDEWRLHHRHVISEWVRNIQFENLEDSELFADLTRAQHDTTDPSFALFQQNRTTQ